MSDDGEWAFVDGSPTGLRMAEASLAEPPLAKGEQSKARSPPPNPSALKKEQASGAQEAPPAEGYAKERFTTEEGPALLRWPMELSEDSVEDIEYWIEGAMRRARRKAGSPPAGSEWANA